MKLTSFLVLVVLFAGCKKTSKGSAQTSPAPATTNPITNPNGLTPTSTTASVYVNGQPSGSQITVTGGNLASQNIQVSVQGGQGGLYGYAVQAPGASIFVDANGNLSGVLTSTTQVTILARNSALCEQSSGTDCRFQSLANGSTPQVNNLYDVTGQFTLLLSGTNGLGTTNNNYSPLGSNNSGGGLFSNGSLANMWSNVVNWFRTLVDRIRN